MSSAFQLVKRSALSFTGRGPGAKGVHSVRFGRKSGRLHFSKGVCEEVFEKRPLALVEYNEAAQTLRFTAYESKEQAPRGVEAEDFFLFLPMTYKGRFVEAAIAARRLLNYLEVDPMAGHWPILETNKERHSIAVRIQREASSHDATQETDAHDSVAVAS